MLLLFLLFIYLSFLKLENSHFDFINEVLDQKITNTSNSIINNFYNIDNLIDNKYFNLEKETIFNNE